MLLSLTARPHLHGGSAVSHGRESLVTQCTAAEGAIATVGEPSPLGGGPRAVHVGGSPGRSRSLSFFGPAPTASSDSRRGRS